MLDSEPTLRQIHVMATMVVELYDALKAAGAPEDKAQAAATALVNTNGRFDRIDRELAAIKGDIATMKSDIAAMKVDIGALKAESGLVKLMISGVGFGVLFMILRSFWPGA